MKRAGTKYAVKRAALLGALGFSLSGCALMSKAEPLAVRYFDLREDGSYRPTTRGEHLRLRLGSVSASRHIDRRIISRRGEHEIIYYENWRWTDQPDAFLRRTLERELFERAGLTRVVSGPAATLQVELVAFEELKTPERHLAHVELSAALDDERVQLWQRSLQVDAPIGRGDPAQALASALGHALAQATAQLTELTAKTLASVARPDAEHATPEAMPPL